MLFALFDAARSRTERYVVDASHEERKRWSSLESREPELNQAIVDVSREDFLVGNFDLKSLFSLSVGGFYSDDCVLWLGTEEMVGKTAAFQRMASSGTYSYAVRNGHGFRRIISRNREFTRQRGEFHYRLGGGSRKDAVDQHHLSLAYG
jgi:hypothetical protein